MRAAGIAVALVFVTVLVGCGDSGGADRDGAAAERGVSKKAGHRHKANLALAKLACGESPKADFAADSVGLPVDSSDRAIARAYAADWPSQDRQSAFAGCLKGSASVPDRFPSSSSSARSIWGRNFLVVSIESKVEDPPVAQPYRARFWFSRERDHSVSWQARCNISAADAHFTDRRIKTKMTLSTLIGCFAGSGREDAWLERFMQSNPEWRISGETLRLTSGRATIELRGYADPSKCPVAPGGGWVDAGNSGYDCEGALNLLALEAIGRDGYLKGWTCRESKAADGQLRTDCRQGDSHLAFGGFDPMMLER